jgi:integrase
MARRLKDAALDSRTARLKLKPRREPYWKAIQRGVHLGYRRLAGASGSWNVRAYSNGAYRFDGIGTADDLADADGVTVLDFWQAVETVRQRMNGEAPARRLRKGGTVADVMADYLAHLQAEGRAAHSITDTKSRINGFVLPTLGNLKADELTTDDLQKWRNGLVKHAPRLRTKSGQKQKHRDIGDSDDAKRSRRATINRTWTVLRAGLNHAFHSDKIASDKAWRKVKPFRAVDAARVRYLSVAEAKRLINSCQGDFRLLVRAALCTGARYGELCALTVADFNADVGTLAIRKSKSGKPRHIVLTDEGRALFAEITAGRSGNELILPKTNGNAWAMSHQLRPMAEAVERAKIKPAISFHGLRHTWASLAVMGGMPLMVVAKNLGHTDTRMVEKHYGHLAPSYVADTVRKHAPDFGFRPTRKVTPFPR